MRPIVIQGSESIAATSEVANVLTDTRIVQCPITGFLTLFLQSDGANPGEVTAEFKINSDEVLINSGVGYADRVPETDKDAYCRRVPVRAGDRLTLKMGNTTAGALNGIYRVLLEPVGRRMR